MGKEVVSGVVGLILGMALLLGAIEYQWLFLILTGRVSLLGIIFGIAILLFSRRLPKKLRSVGFLLLLTLLIPRVFLFLIIYLDKLGNQ